MIARRALINENSWLCLGEDAVWLPSSISKSVCQVERFPSWIALLARLKQFLQRCQFEVNCLRELMLLSTYP